jgi:hypothetical protein
VTSNVATPFRKNGSRCMISTSTQRAAGRDHRPRGTS